MDINGNGRWVHAKYVTTNKDVIEAVWEHADRINEDGEKEWEEVLIPVDLENDYYMHLLDTYSIDEINTMSDQYEKRQKALFTSFVKKVGEDFGLLYNPDAEQGAVNTSNIDMIFEPVSGNAGEDFLFDLKLKIFEMDEVSTSDNEALQTELREADSPLKALYIAGKFLYE
jgi:hypothetical protein